MHMDIANVIHMAGINPTSKEAIDMTAKDRKALQRALRSGSEEKITKAMFEQTGRRFPKRRGKFLHSIIEDDIMDLQVMVIKW